MSDLQSGMGIEYRGLSYIHGHLTPKNKTKKGVIKQVTPNLIAIEGDSYRDTILVNDLLSGQVQIIITEGDGELSAKKEVPTKEKLISLYVKHEGRIDPIRRELRVGSWALVKRWLVEAGIIDSLGRPLEQTPTPEPDQAANQEPERAEAEPAVTSVAPDLLFVNRHHAVAEEIACLLDRKRQDYGTGNIRKFGSYGVLVRVSDKVERLINLSKRDGSPNFESVDDTWKDIAGYAILALIELREGR